MQIKEKERADGVKGTLILDRFMKGKECFKLPKFLAGGCDDPDGRFYDIHLYWRSPNSKEVG
jgi:hypothetical protein